MVLGLVRVVCLVVDVVLPRELLVETTWVLSGREVWGLLRWLSRFLSSASRALLRYWSRRFSLLEFVFVREWVLVLCLVGCVVTVLWFLLVVWLLLLVLLRLSLW